MQYSTAFEPSSGSSAATAENRCFSVAMSATVDGQLRDHLLGTQGEEDLAFALFTLSAGRSRSTALIHTVLLPENGDRQQHGNASFNLQYFERALDAAARERSGIALLHSHIGPGWQGMSHDDVVAEKRIAGTALALTDLPLVGLTIGTDGTWSARSWEHESHRTYRRLWCESVRVVGKRLRVSFDEKQVPPPAYQEMFKRTQTVWGRDGHANMARLRVGVVGLGSVGMALAETLARSGFESLTLIDFDEVQAHNLDRLQGATRNDIGRTKVSVAKALIERSSTAAKVTVIEVPASVVEPEGYQRALDCDVIFSCVDRPRARQILNHIAYAHLIPVIDGGIAVRFRHEKFSGAEWQLQTAGPDHPCLECVGAFSAGDADTERHGMLDDPSYMEGLPHDHHLKRNENVYPFSTNLASLEFLQLVALAAGLRQLDSFGVQRYHFVAGMLESDDTVLCTPECDMTSLTGRGDSHFTFAGRDYTAEKARARQAMVARRPVRK
jgi:hypothetical protein